MLARLLLITVICCAAPSQAALLWQQTNGPYGGYGRTIAVSPSNPAIIYLGTSGSGIYKSTDGGATWTIINEGLVDLSVDIFDIEVHPDNPDIAYAATNGTGVAKTTDGGSMWQAVNYNLGSGLIYDVAIDPRKPNIIYATTQSLALRKSTDEGASWGSAGMPAGVDQVRCVETVSAGAYSVVYAGTLASGLYKSTDEGSTWVNIASGDIDLSESLITAIGVSPSSPEARIYAGVRDRISAYDYRVKKTIDGGGTWEIMYRGAATHFDGFINSIVVAPLSSEAAYLTSSSIGLFKTVYDSGDGRWEWAQKYPDPTDDTFLNVEIHPTDEARIFTCGFGRAFYLSTDEAESWNFSNDGINNVWVTSLLAVPSTEGTIIFAGTENLGIFRSLNSGESWEEVNEGIVDRSSIVYSFAHVPGTPLVFAGFSDYLYKSDNFGLSWESTGLSSTLINQVVCVQSDPVSPEVIYASTSGAGHFYRSLDTGESWSAWNTGLPSDRTASRFLAASIEGRACLHVKLQNPEGVYRRYSDTASWEDVSSGLSAVSGYPSATFAYNYASPEVIYAGIGQPIFSKHLNASAWTIKLTVFPGANRRFSAFVADPNDPSTLYCYSADRDMIRVYNNLSAMVRETTGMENYRGFTSHKPMVLDSYSGANCLYADVGGRSVWRTSILGGDVPAAPSNVSGTALSTSEIEWTWADNSFNEDGFYLYDNGTIVATMASLSSSTVETGLGINSSNRRRVAAYNSYGSQISGLSPYIHTLAAVPGTVEGSDVGITYIDITWEAGGNPAGTRYVVERSTIEAVSGFPAYWEYTGSTESFPPLFHDTGLSPSTVYFYRARGENGNGIQTDFGGSASFETDPPVPSEDRVSPEVTRVEFNERLYFRGSYGEGDIIHYSPRIKCVITDYGSTEPGTITPEGVDISSVKVRFDDYLFEGLPASAFSLSSTEAVPVSPEAKPVVVYMNYEIPAVLGSSGYTCTIEARDLAYPWYNLGAWSGSVRVIAGDVDVVGPTLAYPTPFSPLSGDSMIISYTLSRNADVAFYMYDVSGRIVLTKKFDSGMEGGRAGYNDFSWDGITNFGNVAGNGIYVYKIVSGNRAIATGKLVVLD